MSKEELKEKFHWLYNYMAASKEPKYMILFGDVMKEMMMWMIENKSDVAEKMVEKLCAIKWHQYLTRDEAIDIIKSMNPPAAWDYEPWKKAMEALNLEYEREYVFNSYALWVVMNAVHSDNGNVIANIMRLQGEYAGNHDYIIAIHSLAMNMLLDKDGHYCVRCYFLGQH